MMLLLKNNNLQNVVSWFLIPIYYTQKVQLIMEFSKERYEGHWSPHNFCQGTPELSDEAITKFSRVVTLQVQPLCMCPYIAPYALYKGYRDHWRDQHAMANI